MVACVVQGGGAGALFQPLVEHVKVETLLALRDALTPDARVPRSYELPTLAAARVPAPGGDEGGSAGGGLVEDDEEDTLMEVDDEGLGLGPGPSSGGTDLGVGVPGWEGGQVAGGLPLPPLTRPAPLVEDEEDEGRGAVSMRGASAEGSFEHGGQLPATAAGAGETAAMGPGGPAADGAGVRDPAGGVPSNPEPDPSSGPAEMEAAGERAARVLPVTFALAEAALEALAGDTAAAEALADGSAVPGDPQPVLSQGCGMSRLLLAGYLVSGRAY